MGKTLLSLAALLAVASPAQAASVEASSDCDKYRCTHHAVYTAGPGEINVVEVTRPESGVVRVRDTGADGIRTGAGCTAEDATTVVCRSNKDEGIGIFLVLRDGDDRARGDGFGADGGLGDDTLTALTGSQLTGGPGRDRLVGSPESDAFTDADGRVPARDEYRGGGGFDSIDYRGRRKPVRIDLPGGRAGEDVVESVVSATGGRGADRLIGTGRQNNLSGGAGDDVIEARGGDDFIHPGVGADLVHAGAGRDRITMPDFLPGGTGDRIDCGSGRDNVDSAGTRDLLLPGCEELALNDSQAIDVFPRYFPRGPGALVADLRDCCFGASPSSATLTSGGVVLDSVPRRRRATIRLRLGAQGWAMLRRAGRLEVQVTLRFGAPLKERRGVRLQLRLP